MAKLRITQWEDKSPEWIEEVEVRAWRLGGTDSQPFFIGSGVNFDATANVWIEILYSINEMQVFYTRTFLHLFDAPTGPSMQAGLDRFAAGELDRVEFGDMLPDTRIVLKREKYTPTPQEGQEPEQASIYRLVVSADIGSVLAGDPPSDRSIDIHLKDVRLGDGLRFMRDLAEEISQVCLGKHPDPASFPAGSSRWPFARALNEKAYDRISKDYEEGYFENPLITRVFDSWMAKLPANGSVLDAGCGHGAPVISRLLEHGFRVTGTDISPAMLERARGKYPQVEFRQGSVSELEAEAAFDGVCSLSSLLYLDPIDLYQGIHRLYRALKPGGLLFLYAYETSPGWRGNPLAVRIRQWMWSWTYGMGEAVEALEEHGYFKVLASRNVTTKDEKEGLVEQWRKDQQEDYERALQHYALPGATPPPAPDLASPPDNLGYGYAIIARRKQRRGKR